MCPIYVGSVPQFLLAGLGLTEHRDVFFRLARIALRVEMAMGRSRDCDALSNCTTPRGRRHDASSHQLG